METTLEERVTALETQLAQLLSEKKTDNGIPWHERWKGAFENDEMYEKAMRAGEEYRRSQPTAAEEIEALERAGIHVPFPDGQ